MKSEARIVLRTGIMIGLILGLIIAIGIQVKIGGSYEHRMRAVERITDNAAKEILENMDIDLSHICQDHKHEGIYGKVKWEIK